MPAQKAKFNEDVLAVAQRNDMTQQQQQQQRTAQILSAHSEWVLARAGRHSLVTTQ